MAAQIEAGSDTSDSEAIHDPALCQGECSGALEAIRSALIEGESCGEPEPFDFAAFKPRNTAQHG
jgi:antitoxin ParD1/3/4